MKVTHYSKAIFGNAASFAHTMIQESTHGKIFSGKFLKSDGSVRVFNGRAYAQGSVKGTGGSVNIQKMVPYIDNEVLIKNLKNASNELGRKLSKDTDAELIAQCRQKSWRSFKADNLLELNINGEKIIFQDA